jgi:hypothetical protein
MITVFQFFCWMYEHIFRVVAHAFVFLAEYVHSSPMIVMMALAVVLAFKLGVLTFLGTITYWVTAGTIVLGFGCIQYPFMSVGYKATLDSQMRIRIGYYNDRFCLRSGYCAPNALVRPDKNRPTVTEQDLEVAYDQYLREIDTVADSVTARAEQMAEIRHTANAK